MPSFFSGQKQRRTCIGLCLSLHPFFWVNRILQSSWMSTSSTDLYSGKTGISGNSWGTALCLPKLVTALVTGRTRLHLSHPSTAQVRHGWIFFLRGYLHIPCTQLPLGKNGIYSPLQLRKNSREGLHVHTLTDAWCVSICVHLLQLITERKYLYEYKSMFPSEHYEKECLLLKTEIQNKPFWIWWRTMLYLPCIYELN